MMGKSVYDINVSNMDFLFDRVIKILIKSGYLILKLYTIYGWLTSSNLLSSFFSISFIQNISNTILIIFTTHKFMNASKSPKSLVWKFHRNKKKRNRFRAQVSCLVSFVELELHIWKCLTSILTEFRKRFWSTTQFGARGDIVQKEVIKTKQKLAWIWKIWRLN